MRLAFVVVLLNIGEESRKTSSLDSNRGILLNAALREWNVALSKCSAYCFPKLIPIGYALYLFPINRKNWASELNSEIIGTTAATDY
jgi:hypothetical protein